MVQWCPHLPHSKNMGLMPRSWCVEFVSHRICHHFVADAIVNGKQMDSTYWIMDRFIQSISSKQYSNVKRNPHTNGMCMKWYYIWIEASWEYLSSWNSSINIVRYRTLMVKAQSCQVLFPTQWIKFPGLFFCHSQTLLELTKEQSSGQ